MPLNLSKNTAGYKTNGFSINGVCRPHQAMGSNVLQ